MTNKKNIKTSTNNSNSSKHNDDDDTSSDDDGGLDDGLDRLTGVGVDRTMSERGGPDVLNDESGSEGSQFEHFEKDEEEEDEVDELVTTTKSKKIVKKSISPLIFRVLIEEIVVKCDQLVLTFVFIWSRLVSGTKRASELAAKYEQDLQARQSSGKT